MVLLLLACATSDDEGALWAPAAGWYEVDLAADPSWSCGVDPGGEVATGDAPARASDLAEVNLQGAMTWRWADAYSPLACELDGLSFTCLVYETCVQGDGAARALDAVITEREEIVASWSDPHEMTGAVVRTLACEGEDCDLLGDSYPAGFAFPCQGERALAAVLTD